MISVGRASAGRERSRKRKIITERLRRRKDRTKGKKKKPTSRFRLKQSLRVYTMGPAIIIICPQSSFSSFLFFPYLFSFSSFLFFSSPFCCFLFYFSFPLPFYLLTFISILKDIANESCDEPQYRETSAIASTFQPAWWPALRLISSQEKTILMR